MKASHWLALSLACVVISTTLGCRSGRPSLQNPLLIQSKPIDVRRLKAHFHDQARGYFVRSSPAGFEHRNGAWIRCKGYASAIESATGSAELKRITVYGAPGVMTASQLLHPSYRLTSIETSSGPFDTDWAHDPDWNGETSYSMLEVFIVRVDNGDAPFLQRVEWLRKFDDVSDHSWVVQGTSASAGGSTAATVTCAGSFFEGQGLAMYDVNVTFDTVTAADAPQEIQVFAGLTPASSVLLFDAPIPLPDPLPAEPYSFDWKNRRRIVGSYNGDNSMSLRVAISYLDSAHAPEETTFSFTGLQAYPGEILPGQ